ncbi:MAG: hypothetical protein U9P72_07220 [Campylobacterota bacterium]|nr:hypothetical protein [Campylobacterota bacterium]
MVNKFLFFNIVFLVLLSGCSSKIDSIDETLKHDKDTQELSSIMHELNLLVYDNVKSELELDNVRRRYALTLAQRIKELTTKAEGISVEKLGKKISQKNIKQFTQYMKELRKNGEEIYEIAQKYELEKLDNKIENLKQTCNSCHSQIRD